MMRWERPLDLLDAAYRLDGTEDDWLSGMVEQMTQIRAPEGVGAGAFSVKGQIDGEGRTSIVSVPLRHVVGQDERGRAHVLKTMLTYMSIPLDLQEQCFFSAVTATTASVITGLGHTLYQDPLWKLSGLDALTAKDTLMLTCHASLRDSVVLFQALRDTTTMRPSELSLLRRLATHVGAAFRLRRHRNVTPDRAEAVLSPWGKVQHLALEARRASVVDGFSRRRHARGRGTAPDAALEVWQGLHDGRWSLVDYLDTDGKSFVLAVRNEPGRDVASALTDRQRAAVALASLGYANKQIAYALGLTATAVAMLLARARAATGVRTRAQLVRAFKRTLAESA
jgi:DNA-binding CsgD family transcriptional regulator